jgi:hypothetical protein
MVESEMFLYIVCKALGQQENSISAEEFVHPSFAEFGKEANDKANRCLTELSATEQELKDLIAEYLERYGQKLKTRMRFRSAGWLSCSSLSQELYNNALKPTPGCLRCAKDS